MNPTTLRLGMRDWICSVSGMIVFRPLSRGPVTPCRSTVETLTSPGGTIVGSTTGNVMSIFEPSSTAKAAVKL